MKKTPALQEFKIPKKPKELAEFLDSLIEPGIEIEGAPSAGWCNSAIQCHLEELFELKHKGTLKGAKFDVARLEKAEETLNLLLADDPSDALGGTLLNRMSLAISLDSDKETRGSASCNDARRYFPQLQACIDACEEFIQAYDVILGRWETSRMLLNHERQHAPKRVQARIAEMNADSGAARAEAVNEEVIARNKDLAARDEPLMNAAEVRALAKKVIPAIDEESLSVGYREIEKGYAELKRHALNVKGLLVGIKHAVDACYKDHILPDLNQHKQK